MSIRVGSCTLRKGEFTLSLVFLLGKYLTWYQTQAKLTCLLIFYTHLYNFNYHYYHHLCIRLSKFLFILLLSFFVTWVVFQRRITVSLVGQRVRSACIGTFHYSFNREESKSGESNRCGLNWMLKDSHLYLHATIIHNCRSKRMEGGFLQFPSKYEGNWRISFHDIRKTEYWIYSYIRVIKGRIEGKLKLDQNDPAGCLSYSVDFLSLWSFCYVLCTKIQIQPIKYFVGKWNGEILWNS
jgi:hypothetical protein